MGDQDDDNPATMLLQQVQDPPGAPSTERIPATFADQSTTGVVRRPGQGPTGQPSVKTTPMPMPALGSTMMLPETQPRPGVTMALPPEALQPPAAPKGNAGTLIIDGPSVLAAAGVALPSPPAPPAPSEPPPAIASVRPIALSPQPPQRAPFESIPGRETPPPALESLKDVQPAVPIGKAAPLPANAPNVIVPFADSPTVVTRPRREGGGAGGVVLVLVGALLVGGAAAALLVTGIIPSPWFSAKAPAPEPTASSEATATATTETTATPPTASEPASAEPPPPASETASASASATASADASASATATASASVSASVSASSSGPLPVPSLAVSVMGGDAYLLSYQGYLTVRSNTKADVVLQGVTSGKTNFKMMVRCGQRNVRLRQTDGTWLTEGVPITITCMQHTVTTIDL